MFSRKCLADKKVLLHGDSTTHGLLQEALGMWSEVKPHKDPANKSDVCRFNAAAAIHDGEEIPRNSWTSDLLQLPRMLVGGGFVCAIGTLNDPQKRLKQGL